MAVKPIPEGYQNVIPYLVVKDAASLIDFLKQVFHAVEIERMTMPDGSITHAEVRIGDSVIMMATATDAFKTMPCMLYVYTEDTDGAYHRAITAGAISLMEPADQFYGDRNAGIIDKEGNYWYIGTHVEDVSMEELYKRAKERNKA